MNSTTSGSPASHATPTGERPSPRALIDNVSNEKDASLLLLSALARLESFASFAHRRVMGQVTADMFGTTPRAFRGSRLELDLMKAIYAIYPTDELWEWIGDHAACHLGEKPDGTPLDRE